jgi:aspartate racemase
VRRIGLLGGMSWESSALFYELLNELTKERLGGLHSARVLMSSVDFAEIAELQHTGDWTRAGELLADEARRLEAAGAELLVLCTNTMHAVADDITAAVSIPFLHLGDATGVRSSRRAWRAWPCSGPGSPWSRTSTSTGSRRTASR